MKWVLITILPFIVYQGFSQAERKFVRRGNREFDDKKYQEAEIQYRKAFEKNPTFVAADYNLGNALYREKQYEAAASRYMGLAEKQKSNEGLNRQYYNLGNALYKSGKYKESIEAYKNALRKMPEDMNAKHNLQLAMRKLQEQNRNQQDNQQKNNKQDNKQDNKEDKNQSQQDKDRNNNPQDQGKDQQQQQKNENQSTDKQNVNGQISPADAERILQALENEEKNVLKKVQENKKHVKKVPVEKNW